MRGLLALVVGMGVLIVAGVAVVAVTIIHRMAPALPAGEPALAMVLDEPQGTRILGASMANGRLIVTLQGGGADRVVILDPASGRKIGGLRLSR